MRLVDLLHDVTVATELLVEAMAVAIEVLGLTSMLVRIAEERGPESTP